MSFSPLAGFETSPILPRVTEKENAKVPPSLRSLERRVASSRSWLLPLGSRSCLPDPHGSGNLGLIAVTSAADAGRSGRPKKHSMLSTNKDNG